MKKQNPIDDLFRGELADYTVTPSPERRAALLRDADGIKGKSSRSILWIIGAAGLILIGLGIAVLVPREHDMPVSLANSGEMPTTTQVPSIPGSLPSAAPVHGNLPSAAPAAGSSTILPAKTPAASGSVTMPAKTTPAQGSVSLPAKTTPAGGSVSLPAKTTPAEGSVSLPAKTTPAEGSVSLPGNMTNSSVTGSSGKVAEADQTAISSQKLNDTTPSGLLRDTTTISSSQSKPRHDNSSPPKKWNISLGANYTPEFMFNTLNGDKFANNMGVEGTFHYGRYSVRTGLGLSITTGWNEVLVQSNPYLGTYKALDSIAFSWDTQNYRLIPTFYTKSQEVFDTTSQYTYTNIKKRYTYLQVPLVLGYDFWENSWISFGLRAGAVMSILLNTETSSMTYDPGKDRIITINNITPDRIQLNWQALGGINVAFRLSRRFSIEAEPEIRYYFNSVYESSVLTKKPWSVGLRAAFVVTF